MSAAEAWWKLNGELHQQGPGSDPSTLRALAALDGLPPAPRILDMGCGPGRQSRALAAATGGHVVALDRLAPFLSQLVRQAEDAKLADRISPLRGDMGFPPFRPESFDLVWSEGAVYIPGFEAGLRGWQPLLRPGGFAAVSELSWVGEPPPATRTFWETAYPEVADVATNCARAERAGYEVLSHFGLPRSDWDAYYGPIEERAIPLREEYKGNAGALGALSGHVEEVAILDRSEGSYTYVFYLLRKPHVKPLGARA
jgi:serine/threonine-protein kinase HipA